MTRRFVLSALLFLLLLAGTAVLLSFTLFLSRPVAPAQPVVVTIPAGAAFGEVTDRLVAAGVITDPERFGWLARLRKDTARTRAGEYDFAEPATPGAVLDRLVAGDVRRYRLTIPEGWTVHQIADRLEAEGFAAAAEIRRLAADGVFVSSLGIPAASLEGYLFPETYTLVAGLSPEKLLRTMVREFRDRFPPELQTSAQALGLTPHQLVTLASIIQKEAGNQEEMPLISAVFHNRLRRGIPLQADPTVIYGIENFDGNLTRRHLTETTPYNTYRIRGLPPGPIANPGLAALQAAAAPAAVDYLYFVARGDGTHYFSTTLQEHNRAVRKFQLRRRE